MGPQFTSKLRHSASRAVPNGGLGGYICSDKAGSNEGLMATNAKLVQATTIGKRKQKPPPILISRSTPDLSTSSIKTSAGSMLEYVWPWTPKMPKDRTWLESHPEEHVNTRLSIVAQKNSTVPSDFYQSPPETPLTLRSDVTSLPVELPGSLLLPSQGFPQTDPISPPPSLYLIRRDTQDSTISSVPTLSTSASSNDITMDTLRNLTTSSRRNDQSVMPSYTVGNRNVQESRITKPFTAMTVEELLDYLPQCKNSATVKDLWLPTLRNHIDKMAQLMLDATEIGVDDSLNQITISQDLNDFAHEIRLVSNCFRKIVESAESLAERDSRISHERLQVLEAQNKDVSKKMHAKQNVVDRQSRMIAELNHTICDIVRVLGTFIQNNVPRWIDTVEDPRTHEVLQLVSDYTSCGDDRPVPYLRVPEATISKYAQGVHEAHTVVSEYREMLHGQVAMIREQSHNLDAYTSKYEGVVRLLKQRDHEMALLMQQNEDMTKDLENTKSALAQSQLANVENEDLAKRYEELLVQISTLKIGHRMELEKREMETGKLQQKLGSAREEVIARREDIKNIMSQTRAVLESTRQPEPILRSSNASKALRFLGMEREKDKSKSTSTLASSRSLMSFPPETATMPADLRCSFKEQAPRLSRPAAQHVGSFDQTFHAQNSPNAYTTSHRNLGDANPPSARPRAGSLSAMQNYATFRSPMDTEKLLPDPPARPETHRLSSARVAEITQCIASPTAAQIASDYFKNSVLGQTSARRVLSHIPELSMQKPPETSPQHDGARDQRRKSDDSLASADREMYRHSVCALDMLNSNTLPYDGTEHDVTKYAQHRQTEASPGPEYDEDASVGEEAHFETAGAHLHHVGPGSDNLRAALGNRHRTREVDDQARKSMVSDTSEYQTSDSEPMTVTQLYHEGGRHIRS